jgi:hypothetical protein
LSVTTRELCAAARAFCSNNQDPIFIPNPIPIPIPAARDRVSTEAALPWISNLATSCPVAASETYQYAYVVQNTNIDRQYDEVGESRAIDCAVCVGLCRLTMQRMYVMVVPA